MKKPHPDSISAKFSRKQQEQLIAWLSDHTYAETQELCAAPPPDGFGLEVSITALCRFYKANYIEIDLLRHANLGARAAEQLHYAENRDDLHRENLAYASTLLLQERLYELLSRPVETVDDLKKLMFVCRAINDLDIQLDPHTARKDRLLKEIMGHPLDQLVAARKQQFAPAEAADVTDFPPEDVSGNSNGSA